MASLCLSICSTSKPLVVPHASAAAVASSSSSSSSSCSGCRSSLFFSTPMFGSGCLISSTANTNRSRRRRGVVCMAPDEEKLTRRNPLDFPIVRVSFILFNFTFWITCFCNYVFF